jgi:hypothetical protein
MSDIDIYEQDIYAEDLVGEHMLSGVDFTSYEDAMVMTLILDGTRYSFIEDSDNGYRSMLQTILIDAFPVRNTFEPQRVICEEERVPGADGILTGYDAITHEEVFFVGTDYSDEYYPLFVAGFAPENMSINSSTV